MTKYTSPKETAKYFGVSLHTLRRWKKDSKIQARRISSGQIRYDIALYTELSNQRTEQTVIAYACVSSRRQKADLAVATSSTKFQEFPCQVINDVIREVLDD